MPTWLAQARADFHADLMKKDGAIIQAAASASIADSSSAASRDITNLLIPQLGTPLPSSRSSQTSGTLFEQATTKYLDECFNELRHLTAGQLYCTKDTVITRYYQYAHLEQIKEKAQGDVQLRTLLGADYIVKPDVLVFMKRVPDSEINRFKYIVDDQIARRTYLRKANHIPPPVEPADIMHASISCKLTMRSDRAQNTRTEALNLIRNRKGKLPHVVAITAEPMPSRLASLALGTGDLDCVYHIALPELMDALDRHIIQLKKAAPKPTGKQTKAIREAVERLDTAKTLTEGGRLKDVADLPLDLLI